MATEAAQASRTFRVFVSSTFEDFKAERNALQKYVFPKLAQLCASRNARFQAIDLRWGVSEEASLDQRAISICLTEIERCQRVTPRPNFIMLLGDRYGWRPAPARIDAEEFKAILAKVPPEDAKFLVWDDDQAPGARGWYRRDDNAVPPEFVLRPREVALPEGTTAELRKAAQDAEYAEWKKIEARLRAILLGAIESIGWSKDDKAMSKYVASATEQEIVRGALEADNAAEHVFGFFRSIDTLPVDKSAKDFSDLVETPEGFVVDTDARARLGALKAKLEDLLGNHVSTPYHATWTGTGITTDHVGDLPETLEDCLGLLGRSDAPRTLCVDVWRSIAGVIKSQLGQPETEAEIEREIASHVKFGQVRCSDFVGRDALCKEIASYVAGSESHLLVLIGEGGSGKSALMAKALEEAQAAQPGAVNVVRFIGATPASSDGRPLLDSLCRQMARADGDDVSAIPVEYSDLAVEFGERLKNATADRPLIVFLDALDQLGLTDPARGLSWLPAHLPEHVRLVVSTLPGDCEASLRAKHPEPRFLGLDKLTRQEGETALGLWLGHAKRHLLDRQWNEVLDKFEPEGRPLYLRLAFEEARLWRSFTPPVELHAGIPELIRGDLFARLAAPENHGPTLVAHALGYLAASRYGLAEDELVGVLSADDDVMRDFHDRSPRSPEVRQLPVGVWSRVYFDLEPYLSEHAADGTRLLAFYHRVLGEAAAGQYLAGLDGTARHSSLADYFAAKADPKGDKTWTGGSVRGLSELPFHLANAGNERREDLYATLTDFQFLEHKAAEVGLMEHKGADGERRREDIYATPTDPQFSSFFLEHKAAEVDVMEHKGADGETSKTYTGVFALQDDYALALTKLGGGSAASGRRPLIVTGVDFGQGLVIRCPWCSEESPFGQKWRGTDINCPHCQGPLHVNKFVVGNSPKKR